MSGEASEKRGLNSHSVCSSRDPDPKPRQGHRVTRLEVTDHASISVFNPICPLVFVVLFAERRNRNLFSC